ncbi:uncharacterized protein TRAVEDRAFT_43001 [Trametes versicolor FP-101664 SS1]|uniref:uncharacterized protein n=1 Tax=Trametes versicolor (strain FP-101664) TaxID=717944 RepID=UPI0004622404|nr:uncharacterized protein TRAVEDRAFT_43001 [Trametes versicolor FP-101664 SS1]EIW62656.1 hypothetical protein TRAVEDRAFT_43001 [Trametes versicolor FP-101664 SS1]
MTTDLSSATAIALSNPDLLFALFEHLALFSHGDLLKPGDISSQRFSRESYLRRQTLINAALTCRSFAEPASSVLWRVLYPGLHPLFYPFPGFNKTAGVLESPEIDDAEQLYISPIPNHVLEREPSFAEWERWKICVRRVRCINLKNTRAAFFDEPFIPLLLHASAGVPILPSVQSIAFNEPRGNTVQSQLLCALVGPALSTISVYNATPHAYSTHILDDMEAISRSCDNVQHMLIYSEVRSLSQNWPLIRFPRLHTLYFDCLSWFPCRSMTSQLGALKELEELDISYEFTSSNAQSMAALEDPSPTTPNAFPALRKLHLTASTFQAGQIISSISSTSLQEVRISTYQPVFRADVTPLMQAFPWKQNASSLRRLDLSNTTNWDTLNTSPGDPFYAALFDMFAPLAELHALEYVEISCWSRLLSVSDADVARMARSWPNLQRIVIAYSIVPFEPAEPPIWDPYGLQVARPSLSALVELAERCPALFYCEIPAADVSESELTALEARVAEPRDRPRQTSLRSLLPARGAHCDHFTLCDVDRVARALLALFPSLYGVGRTTRRPSLESGRPSRYSWSGQQRDSDGFRLLERLFELSEQVENFDE